MIDLFIKYLQYEKRLSSHSVLAYQTDLKQFSAFLEGTFRELNPEHADYGMIRSWIIALVESGIESSSVNRKIACLRTFYKFLLREEIIRKDPMIKIRVLKTKKKLPAFIKEADMVNLLDNPIEPTQDTFDHCREQLILELFYGTGIRLSELINLKESAIDFGNRTIKVLGKRNKERVIPFSKHLHSVITHYQDVKRRESISGPDLLLVTNDGKQCYPMMIYRAVRKRLADSSSDKKSPHVLRHTYATHLLDKGAEINAVKDLLGHSSLAATQVYTHNSMEKLKKVFDQAHPKA